MCLISFYKKNLNFFEVSKYHKKNKCYICVIAFEIYFPFLSITLLL
jgi:hypothetical protein